MTKIKVIQNNMIEILSSWAKNIILAIIVISILEMLVPNNKTKKYVKMVMGLYLLFNIISPLVKNKDKLKINDFDINTYVSSQTQNTSIVNQETMDKRLNEIYVEELQKDIKEKVEEQGFLVEKCNVKATIDNTGKTSGITKITLKITKSNKENTEIEEDENKKEIENIMVEEIQKIKEVKIAQDENKTNNEKNQESSISNTDISKIKKFLIDEYEVSEECLEIN